MEKAVTDILDGIGVDKNEYPKFSDRYVWKIISKYDYKLYIVFDKNSSLLYLTQDMP